MTTSIKSLDPASYEIFSRTTETYPLLVVPGFDPGIHMVGSNGHDEIRVRHDRKSR